MTTTLNPTITRICHVRCPSLCSRNPRRRKTHWFVTRERSPEDAGADQDFRKHAPVVAALLLAICMVGPKFILVPAPTMFERASALATSSIADLHRQYL